MIRRIPLRRRYLRSAVAILAAALAILPGVTHAGFTTCITDPTVTLSNGVTVTMDDAISDGIANVQRVSYVLHVPAGVSVTGVTYDQYGSLETLSVVADQQPGGYRDITNVTDANHAPVAGYASVSGLICNQTSKTSSDWTNNNIAVAFNC